jgi:hypothetical protein
MLWIRNPRAARTEIDPLDFFQYPEERDPDELLFPHQEDDADCSPEVDLTSGSINTIPEGEVSELHHYPLAR